MRLPEPHAGAWGFLLHKRESAIIAPASPIITCRQFGYEVSRGVSLKKPTYHESLRERVLI
jgi:hypothetical protein